MKPALFVQSLLFLQLAVAGSSGWEAAFALDSVAEQIPATDVFLDEWLSFVVRLGCRCWITLGLPGSASVRTICRMLGEYSKYQ